MAEKVTSLVERALFGRRHAVGSIGKPHKLSAPGTPRANLPTVDAMASGTFTATGRATQQCLDDRSRGPPVPQRAGQGSAAVLHRPRADGEPQRSDCRRGDPQPL